MKTTAFTLSLICVSAWSFAQQLTHKAVTSCGTRPANCVEIPSNFSQDQLKHTEQIRALQNKQIVRIELCYTRYKQSPDFNQVALNNQRIAKLKEILTLPSDQSIQWVGIEQTGAKTKEAAAHYFHGFRIYTKESIKDQQLYSLKDPGNPAETHSVSNESAQTVQLKHGTLTIPAHAVVDQNGNRVKGNYDLHFREFRDLAEIAFSGIPMVYKDATSESYFRSAGMFEISATQGDKPLVLAKEMSLNYSATEQLPNTNFYVLDTITGLWNKTKNDLFVIEPEKRLDARQDNSVTIRDIEPTDAFGPSLSTSNFVEINSQFVDSTAFSTLSPSLWEYYLRFAVKNPDFIAKTITRTLPDEKRLVMPRSKHDLFVENLLDFRIVEIAAKQMQLQADYIASLPPVQPLPANYVDPGHSYPNLVRQLPIPSFGIFNCDQQNRMGPTVVLASVLIDKKSGKQLENAKVACVIDRVMNGSFSFSPAGIVVSTTHDSDVLIFTEDEKVYHLSVKAVHDAVANPKDSIVVTEISSEVKTSDDLKAFLNL